VWVGHRLCAPAAVLMVLLLWAAAQPAPRPDVSGFALSEFIYEAAPFASAHASTIEETADGLVAAWFGGTAEGTPMSASGRPGSTVPAGRLRSKWPLAPSRMVPAIPGGTRCCFGQRMDRYCCSTRWD